MNDTIMAHVPLRSLRAEPDDFSPRLDQIDPAHVAKLAGLLKEGTLLDPLDVWQRDQGDTLVILDGHHRHAAYRRVKWRDRVPVRVHRGSYPHALAVASHENGKLRRPLSNAERVDWAWKLERLAEAARRKPLDQRTADDRDAASLSLARIAAAAGVSKRTVATMRKLAREAAERPDLQLSGRWITDQRAILGQDVEAWSEDEQAAWRSAAVERLSESLGKAMKAHLGRKPDIVAEALQVALGRRAVEVTKLLSNGIGLDEFDDDDREF